MNDRDAAYGDAELIGNDLREGGFASMALRAGAGRGNGRAVRIERDGGTFLTPAAGFDIDRDADTDDLARAAAAVAVLLEVRIAGMVAQPVEGGFIVAGVQHLAGRAGMGERCCGHEVAASDLDRVEAGRKGGLFHKAFHQLTCLRPPRAAVYADRRGVGHDAPGRDVHGVDGIGAGQNACGVPGRNRGACGQPVAERAGDCRPQSEKASVRRNGKLAFAERAAPVRGRQ